MVDRPTLDLPAEDERLARLLIGFAEDDLNEAEMAEWDTALAGSEALQELLIATCLQRQLLPQVLADASDATPSVVPAVPPASPVLGFLGNVTHGAFAYFSEGWPLAYLLGTIIFGLGLGIFSLIPVSHHTQIAKQTSTPATRSIISEKPSYVGHITGMVDCRWEKGSRFKAQGSKVEDPQFLIPSPQSPVSLGDKFALASGLMEITYDTGAKVILQGPVTYEVDSRDSGYLSVGKLTARLEKKRSAISSQRSAGSGQPSEKVARGQGNANLPSPASGRGAGGEGGLENSNRDQSQHALTLALSQRERGPNSNPESPIPTPPLSTIHYPLFTIKTPTAIVTDLGTEFGVEVDKKGTTTSHVFCGVVEIQSVAQDSRQGRTIRLSENESACVKRKSKSQELTVRRVAVDPLTFVRCKQFLELARERKPGCFDRWRAYSEQLRRDPSLLAYYDFQQKEGLPAVLPNVAANGDHALDGVVANATWSTGRMPGKHALLFQNPSDCVRFNLPQSTSDLTLAAWVCFDAFDSSFHAASGLLMSESQNVPAGIRWQVWHRDGCLSLSLPGDGIAASPAIDHKTHRWVHLASVYDRSAHQVRSFVDGHCVGSGDLQRNNPVTIGTARIGNRDSQTSQFEFRGLMDELVIVGRTLTADEIRQMCREGQPQTVCQPASRSLVRSLAKPIGPGVELVRNGGFEAAHPGGVNGGWFHDADGWDVVTAPFQAYTGSPHSGQFRGAVWDGGVGTQKQFYANGFDPTVARLAFHGWAKAEVAGGVARVSVTVGNMTGDVFIVHNTRSFTIAETTWTEVAGELTVQHGRGTNLTNYVEIRLTGEGTAPQKAGQFDDLSLVTVEKKSSRQ